MDTDEPLKYELYEHHGTEVTVREDLKGRHREFCLCHSCNIANLYDEQKGKKCPIANKVFALCKSHHLVLPVWECQMFEEK